MNNQLNIASLSTSTCALGPGMRAVVWVQGCPFHCNGCISPDWIPFIPNRFISPRQLAEVLLTNSDVNGITISGGEPMAQAAGLAQMVKIAKLRRELNIICFTGYKYETLLEMKNNPGIQYFLGEIDVLVDGPYINYRHSDKGLRGSDNQRFIHLTHRLKDYDFDCSSRTLEIQIHANEILMIGIPPVDIDPVRFLDHLGIPNKPKERIP